MPSLETILPRKELDSSGREALSAKLWRETSLLSNATLSGFKEQVEEIQHRPGVALEKLAESAGTGLTISYLARSGGMPYYLARGAMAAMGVQFIKDVCSPARARDIRFALRECWQSKDHWDFDLALLKRSAAPLVFDTLFYGGLGGALGSGLGYRYFRPKVATTSILSTNTQERAELLDAPGKPRDKNEIGPVSRSRGRSPLAGYSRQDLYYLAHDGGRLHPSADYQTYLEREIFSRKEMFREYNLTRHPDTKLLVSQTQSNEFAKLHALRYLSEHGTRIDLHRYGSDKRARLELLMKDAERLAEHPLQDRATPQLLAELLDRCPDSRYVKRLISLDECHFDEPWLQRTVDDHVNIRGESNEEGEIWLFRPTASGEILRTFSHEFAHLRYLGSPRHAQLFADAAELERNGYFKREYAKPAAKDESDAVLNNAENYAVHMGEIVLAGEYLDLLTMSMEAPIRSRILAADLEDMVSSLPHSMKTDYHRDLLERALLLKKHSELAARAALAEHICHSNSESMLRAIQLIGEIGVYSGENAHQNRSSRPSCQELFSGVAGAKRRWHSVV